MSRKLSNFERETIVAFNEGDNMASIFTYNKTWQKHLEQKVGLKSTLDNGFGGKGYEIDKKKIKPPRPPVRLSPEARAKLSKRMKDMSQKRPLRFRTKGNTVKSGRKNQNKSNTISQQPSLLEV